MHETSSGIRATALHDAVWRKSRRSNSTGNCVEMAKLSTGHVAVRNSRHPDGPALIYSRAEFGQFLRAVKDGQFDGLLH